MENDIPTDFITYELKIHEFLEKLVALPNTTSQAAYVKKTN